MEYTICLNMIVKNESAIIVTTLTNILEKIKIDYWVISDTGSDDNTKELIINFFKEKNIPGKLIDTKWKNFGYNRTIALEAAYNKTDYLFIFDADDVIVGNIMLPNKLTFDAYEFKFGDIFSYNRVLLVNNRIKWLFKGILHEFICTYETITKIVLEGNYYILSGRTGNRNKDKDKYLKDAIVLSKEYEIEQDLLLKSRYAFYCAQSYKDYNYKEQAILWYLKCLDLEISIQEKYYSCLMLGNLYSEINDTKNAQMYWLKTMKYDSERIEGILFYIYKLRKDNNHVLINLLYNKYKNYTRPVNKIYIYQEIYNNELEFENSISAYYVDDFKSGYECCKIIIINNIINKNKLHIVYNNLFLYKECIANETIEICLLLINILYNYMQSIKYIHNNLIQLYNIFNNRILQIMNNMVIIKNKNKLMILNLDYNLDKKNNMIKQLTLNNLDNSSLFFSAIDGNNLILNDNISKLFDNNKFNDDINIMACALNHLQLWEQLIEDNSNDYYIIMEDNIILCNNFKEKIESLYNSFEENDIIYLGYNNITNLIESQIITIEKLNKKLYTNKIFAYSINKNAAKKIINYIKTNNIKYPIDQIMIDIPQITHYETKPLLVYQDKN